MFFIFFIFVKTAVKYRNQRGYLTILPRSGQLHYRSEYYNQNKRLPLIAGYARKDETLK